MYNAKIKDAPRVGDAVECRVFGDLRIGEVVDVYYGGGLSVSGVGYVHPSEVLSVCPKPDPEAEAAWLAEPTRVDAGPRHPC